MTVYADKKKFKNLKFGNNRYDISLKLARYVYDHNNLSFLLKIEVVSKGAAEGISKKIIKKSQEFIKILILISLKSSL